MDRQPPPSAAVRSGAGRPLRAAIPTLLLLLLFANTNQAYRILQVLEPALDTEREDINFVDPAAPAGGFGVGYKDPPKSGSECGDNEDYKIENRTFCEILYDTRQEACRETTDVNGTRFPNAVICPVACELVTKSSDPDLDKCINVRNEPSAFEVKCQENGIFAKTEKCHIRVTPVTKPIETNMPTAAPISSAPVKTSDVPTSAPVIDPVTNVPPSVYLICGASQEEYQDAVLNFLRDNSLSQGPLALCQYSGIECDDNNENIIKILLADKALKGNIPEEIGCLTALTHLDLSSNQLTGQIPSTLKCPALRELNLAHNSLTGPVPESVFSLADLEEVKLDRNKLSGPLSSAVGKLGSLKVLSLFSNNLYGYVPEQLGSLLLLKELHLDQNIFQGRCDPDLCENVRFGNLAYLSVDCHRVHCPCATHCRKAEIIQLDNNWGPPIDISANPGNSDQFDPNQNQGYNGASNYNWGGNTKREACLCDPLTGRPCIRPRQQGCRYGFHWCNFACNGTFPCRCDARNQPCERDYKRICGSVTYACHNCSRGGLRGRCVCDYQTGLPCIMMKYPVCGLNYYECNMCGSSF